jgi:hypothetical protein
MSSDPDRYEAWYAEKLWRLLPAVYRARDADADADDVDAKGPLEEIVERIGAQTAVVRRSIDRLWEDQSIETCDDWVIDYIGDLLATNLVSSLDARGRRLDVGKTIYYRRRKGTVGLLEELATDVTGWSARVVEFFQRLARTRHGLDPAIGPAALPSDPRGRLQRAQGLVGERTRTGAGGLADLRDVHGASLGRTAFDEYAHTADVRRGRGVTGWHDIPRLGVFVWRLRSQPVVQVTPVEDSRCTGRFRQYTFDPTGRDAPLFAAADHRFGDQWVSPQPHQMPGPISPEQLAAAFLELYPRSLAVYQLSVPDYELIPSGDLAADPRNAQGKPWIDPVRGRVLWPTAPTSPLRVHYHRGFSSEIGAGSYERPPPARDVAEPPVSEASDPTQPLTAAPVDQVVIGNSLTYGRASDLAGIEQVEIRAGDRQRPLLRPTPVAAWTLTGAGDDSLLILDGLWIGGGADLVLRGRYRRVLLSSCTLDPGTWDPARAGWARAADDRPLAPTRLRVQAAIGELVIDRSITGPIVVETQGGHVGRVEQLVLRESIAQSADPGAPAALVVPAGEVSLSRSTLLGTGQVHRLDASECILHDVVTVDDCQHGCVRFSAHARGSALPRQYRCAAIDPRAALFGSLRFGRADYAQLLATAGPAIAEGAEDGSEMGAFWRERSAIKERSLLIKYQEYLPLGLEPVVVHVT